MIILTKLNGVTFGLNSDLIETIEETPDTTIRLTTKNYHIVQESTQEVIDKIVDFKNKCYNDMTSRLKSNNRRLD